MKKFTLSMVIACTLCVAAAVAQMAPGSSGQGTSQSSPTMGGPQGRQPGMGQPGQNDPMGQPGQAGQDQTGNPDNNRMDNSEHKIKGCVQSQSGQYILETKKGKMVALTGQDVSAHVGHEVSVKGTWASGMSQSSTGSASGNEKTFNVTDVKMISDTCGGKGKHSESGGMGTGANGTNPNGSGTGPSGASGNGTGNPGNSGAGTQGPGGTGTQPPQ